MSTAIEVITSLDEAGVQAVQMFTETESREDLIDEINKYLRSGTYSGGMGDLLPYIGASFLGQPLLIMALTVGGQTCTYADPTFTILGGQEEVQDPCVVVQSGSHYEDFLLSEEAKEVARQFFEELKKGSRTSFNPGPTPKKFNPILTSTPLDTSRETQSCVNRYVAYSIMSFHIYI